MAVFACEFLLVASATELERVLTGGKRLAYVDPALNAAIVIDGTTIWAYRYKAA